MITKEIINNNSGATKYNWCQYELSPEHIEKILFWQNYIVSNKEDCMHVTYLTFAEIEVKELDEDGELYANLYIDSIYLKIYDDTAIFKLIEKYSDEAYEIMIDRKLYTN